MKKIISFVVIMSLLLCMGVAYAYNWTDVTESVCEEYSVSVDKYQKVESDVGVAYRENPAVTAKKGDTVYFNVNAYDEKGEAIEVKIEYHDLADIKVAGKIYSAKVTGNKPYVKAYITEKTAMDELYFKGEHIIVSDNVVVIGDLQFTRENGIVVDIYMDGNALELKEALAKLGMTVEDIYNGKVCMSDDVLIANFGRVCNTEDVAYWYVASNYENGELGIPKTGDVSVLPYAGMLLLGAVAPLASKRRK